MYLGIKRYSKFKLHLKLDKSLRNWGKSFPAPPCSNTSYETIYERPVSYTSRDPTTETIDIYGCLQTHQNYYWLKLLNKICEGQLSLE